MSEYSIKVTKGKLTVEATADASDAVRELFDYALNRSQGLTSE